MGLGIAVHQFPISPRTFLRVFYAACGVSSGLNCTTAQQSCGHARQSCKHPPRSVMRPGGCASNASSISFYQARGVQSDISSEGDYG